LASAGYHLLLIGRQLDRLEAVCRETAQQGIVAQAVAADLSDPAEIARVADRIGGLGRIDFLVNNAGFGTMGDLADVDVEMHCSMVNVHCLATVRLSHAALQLMRTAGRGRIVNVASMSAFIIGPGQATYAATKAMLVSFSESLQGELEGTQIRVQALCPGFTRTGFHDRPAFEKFDRGQIASNMWMTPDDVVAASLRGLQSRRVVCIPGRKNRWLARAFGIRKIRKIAGNKVRKR
jgi:short-subunit dehydrogenase